MRKEDEPIATPDDEAFAKRARALFEQSVDDLDANTQSRLNRGRQAALAELDKSGPLTIRAGQWVPAAGVAAAAVVAIVLWNGNVPDDPIAPPSSATDFEILMAEDSFEMLEDLEFYAWIDLEAEPEDTDDNVG